MVDALTVFAVTALVVLIVMTALLALALVRAGRLVRRNARRAQVRISQAIPGSAFGDALWRRSARITSVEQQVENARTLAAHTAFEGDMTALCDDLDASCKRQRAALSHVAPLRGMTRDRALLAVDADIAGLEAGATAVRRLGDRIVRNIPVTEDTTVEAVRRRAELLGAALDELAPPRPENVAGPLADPLPGYRAGHTAGHQAGHRGGDPEPALRYQEADEPEARPKRAAEAEPN